ncbi:cell wall-active antibiotics response protein LiaF [Paenibacillus hamazuiensis]|uniref:cell wall-active antibiotics response protein LiaF n=1 Tax=Paenibacillus hamazuiensis TaxID=2936508 RepID=UPI00200FFA5E|nr:cell wall-active antibiotics response protein LiaF [Paenibacillus hamazuiensis]
MALRRLLFNRFTGYIALFAAAYAAAVRSGFAEWLDPLFGLMLGLLSYRRLSKRLAVIPWTYAAVQSAFIFGLPPGGTAAAVLLMSCGYLLLLNPSEPPLAPKLRVGDVHIRPPEMSDIRIEQGIGDVHIDFSSAFTPPGEHRVVVNRLMGNVIIYVPYGLGVKTDIEVMFGKPEAFGQKSPRFPRRLRMETGEYEDAPSRLHIAISAGIGDVDVRYL